MMGNLTILLGLFLLLNLFILTPLTAKFQNKTLPWLENLYEKALKWILSGRKPIVFLLGTFGMLFFSFFLMGKFTPKVSFFPSNEPNLVYVVVQEPIGTDIQKTNTDVKKAEDKLNAILAPYMNESTVDPETGETVRFIKSIIAQIGEGAVVPGEGAPIGETPHKALITISFAESKYRGELSTSEVMTEISHGMSGLFSVDVQVTVDKEKNGPPMEPPVNIEVTALAFSRSIITGSSGLPVSTSSFNCSTPCMFFNLRKAIIFSASSITSS